MPSCYTLATEKLREGKHDNSARDAAIRQAKIDYVRLVFEELEAVEPLKKKEIPKEIKVLSSHLFSIE